MQLKCDKNQVRRVHQGVIIILVVPPSISGVKSPS